MTTKTRDWVQTAAEEIGLYAIFNPGPFLIEDARVRIAHVGEPSDPRDWGHAARAAERQKRIRRIGYAATRSSRGSPKVLWAAA